MILLIDNYDSFSYNLYQMIGSYGAEIKIIRNRDMTIPEIEKQMPSHIVLSPGPGKPQNAGICIEVIQKIGGKVPILGVCLGHQAIFEAFGGVVSYAQTIMHGKQSLLSIHTKSKLFAGMPRQIQAARYHSLAAQRETIPRNLRVIAESEGEEIMAIEDESKKIYGVQFHPESILTPLGNRIIENFLNI